MSGSPTVESSPGTSSPGTAPQTAGSLGPGSVLGKYRLTRRLGEGGMGVVFAGVHEKLGRTVAIKVLNKDLCESQEQATRFQLEAELVTRIGHPNIVAVYDFGRLADGSLYYVMEVLTGESMRARLNRGPLSDRELIDVFSQLLSAVKAAHDVGAIHRDLKPDAVMRERGAGISIRERREVLAAQGFHCETERLVFSPRRRGPRRRLAVRVGQDLRGAGAQDPGAG